MKSLGWLCVWVALENTCTCKLVWERFSTKGDQHGRAHGLPKWTFLHKIHKATLVTHCMNIVRYFPDRKRWSPASDIVGTKDQRAKIEGQEGRKRLRQ